MQKKRLSLVLLMVLMAVSSGLALEPAWAGNWAVVTVKELPEFVTAGRPFTIHFTVRQHGQRPMGGLSPMVTAVNPATGEQVKARAEETADTGVYAFSLTLPSAGQWQWSIDAFTATYAMPPLAVEEGAATVVSESTANPWPLAAGLGGALVAVGMAFAWRRQPGRLRLAALAAALVVTVAGFIWAGQRPLSLAAQVDEPLAAYVNQGEALFVAKGCIQCHQNGNVTMARTLFPIGPNLTNYEASPEFLRMWLADPPSIKPETAMPDLELSEAEIEKLIAFLGPRTN